MWKSRWHNTDFNLVHTDADKKVTVNVHYDKATRFGKRGIPSVSITVSLECNGTRACLLKGETTIDANAKKVIEQYKARGEKELKKAMKIDLKEAKKIVNSYTSSINERMWRLASLNKRAITLEEAKRSRLRRL